MPRTATDARQALTFLAEKGRTDLSTASAPHIEALLQHDIDVIRAKLLEMLAQDERALTQAFDALVKRDRQLAYSVILRDRDIDLLETELDQLCLEFIMRHQPVAAHLRFVYAASKIISQLERVGDYAESIARQALLVSSMAIETPMDDFAELVGLAVPMLRNSVHAFADRDGDLARATMQTEPRVNRIRDRLIAGLINWRVEGRLPLEALTPLITMARRFERVSDQATNICEQALYFVTGSHVRHSAGVTFKVLFVDANHGALSRLAESAGRSTGEKRFTFFSAGVKPAPAEEAVAALPERYVPEAKSAPACALAEVDPGRFQVIVALDADAERALGEISTNALRLEWSLRDPAASGGSAEHIEAAYEQLAHSLGHHINDLMQAILGRHPGKDK